MITVLRPRVLVVDEYAPFCEAMEYCLPLFGLDPIVAVDERMAWELADLLRIDAVMLDIGLPALTGLTLCRRMVRSVQLGGTPVVLLSGVLSPEIVEQAHAAGAAKLIAKPFLWPDLLSALERVMAPASARGPDRPAVLPVAWAAKWPQT